MSDCRNAKQIDIVGVALAGSSGFPVIVFEAPSTGEFLALAVSPFDAEALIRHCVGEGEEYASALAADLLRKNPPRRAIAERAEDGHVRIRLVFDGRRFSGSPMLAIGDGLALANRLEIPLYTSDDLFFDSREELSWLTERESFGGDFLYLKPSGFAHDIPVV